MFTVLISLPISIIHNYVHQNKINLRPCPRQILLKLKTSFRRRKETKYQLRNKRAHRPEIKSDRFKNVFENRLILDIIFDLSIICI